MATRMRDDDGIVPSWTPAKAPVTKTRSARAGLSVSLDFQRDQPTVVSSRNDAQALPQDTDSITPTSSAIQDHIHANNAEFVEAAVSAEKIQRLATTATPEQVAALITRLLALRTAEKKAQTLEQNNLALLGEVQRLRGIITSAPATAGTAGGAAEAFATSDNISADGAAVIVRARAQQAEAAALATRVSSALAQGAQVRMRPTAAPATSSRVAPAARARPVVVPIVPATGEVQVSPVLAPGVVNFSMFTLKRNRSQVEETTDSAAEVPEEPVAKRASP